MTSKLTRDRLQEIAEDGFLKHGESKELARMALAAMESEPVATLDVQSRRPDGNKFALVFSSAAHKLPDDVYFLYRHAQPAPVVPEVDADDNFYSWFGREWAENYQHNQYTTAAKQMLGVMAESAWKAGRRAAMLAAAPQSPGSEPATMPGKWIPVSEQKPDCWCLTCRPVVLNDMRFVVCPDCGNKRCPRANDHRNACTGSNEPGQEGGAYPDTPQEVKP